MDVWGRPLRNRVFNAAFATFFILVGVNLVESPPIVAFLLICFPLAFVFDLLSDVLGRHIREWRAS